MFELCMIPMLFLSYTATIQTSWHTSASLDSPSFEFQTCRDGFGGRVAASDQFVQAGPQYGYTWQISGPWSVTANIHGGLGFSNTIHPTSGIRQVTLYNGGVGISLNYDRYSVKCGYDHMSNGRGLDPTNHGQDLVTCGLGIQVWR